MTSSQPFRLPVADLLRRPGSSRSVAVTAPLAGLENGAARVPETDPVTAEVLLERITEGIVVRGRVEAAWQSLCSRCLQPVSGRISAHVDELYETEPLAGETYGLDDDVVDLEPLVRDVVLLELPGAPLCRDDCEGLCPTCGVDRNTTVCDCSTETSDPRWAALGSLEL